MKTQKNWKKSLYFGLEHKWVAVLLGLFAIWFILSNLGELIILGIVLYLALKWYPNYLEKKESGEKHSKRSPRHVIIIDQPKVDYIQDDSITQKRQVV